VARRGKTKRNPRKIWSAATTRGEWERRAQLIEDEFTGTVASVRIRTTFTDWDGTKLRTEWDRTRTATDKAAFMMPCVAESPLTWAEPRRCEGGGFDFGRVVHQAISDRQATGVTGNLTCTGRRDGRPCHVTAHYVVDVAYT